ncbi:hypothetical protein FALBO_15206 [Fusarium albosuccineum]|uniref:Uncharacterized protein n=1 Tax=Fusarium albosuccineum TaxID=1237068 RepID=A0A8H4KTY5_9HYPO|nr:hypothetical protein FALBO_15206 [Fusarium albosuccineum]
MLGRRINKTQLLMAVRRGRAMTQNSNEVIFAHEELAFDMCISTDKFIFTARNNTRGLLDVTKKAYPHEDFSYGNFASAVKDLTGAEVGEGTHFACNVQLGPPETEH